MNRSILHPLCVLALAALATVVAVDRRSPTLAQESSRLPAIDKKTHRDYTENLTKSVSFEMIAIPGGTFLMGSPDDEKSREPHEGPRHPVRVKPFWMGKCEVTWDEYDLYWRKRNGAPPQKNERDWLADAVSKPSPPYIDETFGHGRAGHPALGFSFHSAMEYCRWLSAKTGKGYRLPTEAEWEWACRAGTTTPYSFADGGKLGDYAWIEENSNDTTHPVGKKKPNPWGLYDMHGNVAEYCIDYYQKNFYSTFPNDKPALQPVNLPRPARFPYVVRGGSWTHGPAKCRSAARLFSDKEWIRRDPDRNQSIWWLTDADFVGFRVVCIAPEHDNLSGVKSRITRESPNYEGEAGFRTK